MNTKKGYTLLELMIIIGIIGMTLVIVTLVTKPSVPRQLLQDAEYLGDVLEIMQHESQMQDIPLTIIVNQHGISTNSSSANNMLSNYRWNIEEIDSKLGWSPVKNQISTWQRTITQEPLQNPFHISLTKGIYKIILAGDGSGRYKTKPINLKYETNESKRIDNNEAEHKESMNKKKNHLLYGRNKNNQQTE